MAKEILDLTKPLYVTLPTLMANGREFSQDDEFDWRRIDLSAAEVLRLFTLRYITHSEPNFEIETYGIRIVKRGKEGGWFNVVDNNGKPLNKKALNKQQAQEFWQLAIETIESGSEEGREIASTYDYEAHDARDEEEETDDEETDTDSDDKSQGGGNPSTDGKSEKHTDGAGGDEETEETITAK